MELRMKKITAAFFLSFVFALSIEGVLPPLYETSAVIKSIMSDEQLGKKLQSGEAILTVQKNDNGYEIMTNHHKVQVNVIYQPTDRPGPAKYIIQFEDPVPVKS